MQETKTSYGSAVLATATGYSADKLSEFARSLARYSPSSLLVLFVDRVRADVKSLLSELGVPTEFVVMGGFDSLSRAWLRERYRLADILSVSVACLSRHWKLRDYLTRCVLHPMLIRFIIYRNWLAENHSRVKNVFMLDSRDIVVLGDLEKCVLTRFTIAEEAKRVIEEPMNLAWMYRSGFDSVSVFQLLHHRILCAGAIAGPSRLVFDYLEKYRQLVVGNVASISNRPCLDQAVFNWLGRQAANENTTTILPFVNSAIVNLGSCEEQQALECLARFMDSGWPTIIHQYDRFANFHSVLRSRFADVFHSTKPESLACE